jgi:hypothetical protein
MSMDLWWLSVSGPRMLKAEAKAATSRCFFKATFSGERSASNSSESFFTFIRALEGGGTYERDREIQGDELTV